MAAQLGYLRGAWNEFMPKASLLVLLLPVTLWVFALRRWAPSFALLVVLFLFSYHEWLSNGYMDGYLAIYSGLAVLFAGRYLRLGRVFDLHSACCAVGIACSLKNEGLFVAVCLGSSVLAVAAYSRVNFLGVVRAIRARPALLVVPAVSMAPVVGWSVLRTSWHLQNSLTAEPSAAWSRLLGRLSDGESVGLIFEHLAVRENHLWLLAILLAIVVAANVFERRPLHLGALAGVSTAALHFAGMFLIYLSTPTGLVGHLETSAFRTMNTTRVVMLMALYFLMADMERTEQGAECDDGGEPVPHAAGAAQTAVLS